MAVPLVVVEASSEAFEHAIAEIRAAGWTVLPGWRIPVGRPSRTVLSGAVLSREDAEAALLAALDGFGVIIAAASDRVVTDRLVDDLRHLGPVDHRIAEPDAGPTLPADARAILGLLAEGHSLGEAAVILGLSRRTADRRLASAREALGVERTTEAIARAKRLGWLRKPSGP
jgi:DNA-binding CsgD family transcriptional regulator